MERSSRGLAWVLVVGIVGLSIIPPDYRVITDLPRPLEHLSIFLLAGLAFGLGYPDRYPSQTIALVLFAAAVELVQVWVPGRHPLLRNTGGLLSPASRRAAHALPAPDQGRRGAPHHR